MQCSGVQDLPNPAERGRLGRLKLYLGFASGGGKNRRMLEEAHLLKKHGVDVVGAFLELRGRVEVESLVNGLEIVPRKKVEYRGIMVEEMDLEAVLARHPQVALVDEIPHTNLPGSRNRKRYQDVLELLQSGVSVVGTLNIQHLESMNALVVRCTGMAVRERIPDSFLEQPEQIVDLDQVIEDLMERLAAGQVYPPEMIAWTLEHFFRNQNLNAPSELLRHEEAKNLDSGIVQARVGRNGGSRKGFNRRSGLSWMLHREEGTTQRVVSWDKGR